MNYEKYTSLVAEKDLNSFRFTSEGPMGSIKKVILFQSLDYGRVASLVLLDQLADGTIGSDEVTSNNGDRQKIIGTVMEAVGLYTERYPKKWVYFRGSTSSRLRLFRIILNRDFEALSRRYQIYSIIDGAVCPFTSEVGADAYLARRKS